MRSAIRLTALLLVGLHALALFVLGTQIPADDIILGDLGRLLMMVALCLAGLATLSWFMPTFGGALLMVLGGMGIAIGAGFTVVAAVLFGAPSFVAGLLFVGARPED